MTKEPIRIAIAMTIAALPALLYAYASGPDPRYTGAPGDQTCVSCHIGTSLNGGGGRVQLASSSGSTYTPGQQQTLTLTITDPNARVYGFEMTARLDSNPSSGQAGDFTAGPQQQVICDSGSLKGNGGCPSSATVQFLEHNSPFSSNAISVLWTAPASNVGAITIYVAANAANGNGSPSGDHIYTTSLKLTPALVTIGPSIKSGGVVSASGFDASAGVASGTWLEIFGANLASTTRTWQASDFHGNAAPTSLDGVSVTIGGKNAYVDFVSPAQVNVQVPDGIPLGSGVTLVLKNSSGETDPYPVQTSELAPALLAPASFAATGKQYAVATFSAPDPNGLVFVGPAGAIAGVATRPAAPGDVITLFGIGFGPVSPSVGAGVIATEVSQLTNPVTFLVGQAPATVLYRGLAPGFVGLYQFNVQLPSVVSGDSPLTVQSGGRTGRQKLFLATTQGSSSAVSQATH